MVPRCEVGGEPEGELCRARSPDTRRARPSGFFGGSGLGGKVRLRDPAVFGGTLGEPGGVGSTLAACLGEPGGVGSTFAACLGEPG